jgi:hypothetical protein
MGQNGRKRQQHGAGATVARERSRWSRLRAMLAGIATRAAQGGLRGPIPTRHGYTVL